MQVKMPLFLPAKRSGPFGTVFTSNAVDHCVMLSLKNILYLLQIGGSTVQNKMTFSNAEISYWGMIPNFEHYITTNCKLLWKLDYKPLPDPRGSTPETNWLDG